MNLFSFFILLAVLALIAVAALYPSHGKKFMRRFTHQLAVHAYGDTGTQGTLPFTTNAAWSTPNLVVMQETDTAHINLCDGSARPIGFVPDSPASGDLTTVQLLGKSLDGQTKIGYASGAVTKGGGAYVDNANPGKLMNEPTAAGVYWRIGTFNTDTSGAGPVVVNDHAPIRVKVISKGGIADLAALMTAMSVTAEYKLVA